MKLHLIDGTVYECQVGGSVLGHQVTSVELDYDDFVELADGGQSGVRRASNQAWLFEVVFCRLVPKSVRARNMFGNTITFVRETLRQMNGAAPDDETVVAVTEKVLAALPKRGE